MLGVTVIIDSMNHDDLLRKIQELEQYEREQVQERDKAQDRLKQLDSDFADTKQKAANALADAAKQASGLGSGAVDSTKRSYEDKQEHIKQESEEQEKKRSEMQDHVTEIERVLAELKKVEPTLREIEQKTQYWVDQADNLMGRTSGGLF